ncbi:SAM-dependent methyltransferase (plasmid) [Streptomyces halstedii]|uniref:SAM-dependent methyltransferase n=1 Tax=Streptomyces halstedii TaxID=1944 RepID=UPI002F913455
MSAPTAAHGAHRILTTERTWGLASWASRANSARLTDLALGGTDNYEPDHIVARQLTDVAPYFASATRINAVYNHLTIGLLTKSFGIRGFLDLGAGLPTLPPSRTYPDTHRSAEDAAPGSRVVQVDHDPVVDAHLRMCSAGRHGQNRSIIADLRDIETVLAHPFVQALKESGPVGVLVHDVLPYITCDRQAARVLHAVQSWLPPGSAVSLTHATGELHPTQMAAAAEVLQHAGLPYRLRPRDQVHDLLAPWPLLKPGVVPTGRYHPAHKHTRLPEHHSGAYAAIAVHPRRLAASIGPA